LLRICFPHEQKNLSPRSVPAFQGIAGFTDGNTPSRKLEELGGADMMRDSTTHTTPEHDSHSARKND